jgi:hypothetical protein
MRGTCTSGELVLDIANRIGRGHDPADVETKQKQ